MWLARKRVQQLRYELYSPGGQYGHDDFNNVNVEVSKQTN